MAKRTPQEEKLVSLLKARDKRVIKEIYELYGANLLGVIEKIVKDSDIAEDVLQDSFVKIWKKSDAYDPAKGRLFTWLINICRNSAIDKIRSSGYKHMLKIRSEGNPVSMSESHSYSMNTDQIGVREWVNKLKPEFIEIITTVYFEGYSHSEAAEKLELPLGTLKTRLRAAMKELRKLTYP